MTALQENNRYKDPLNLCLCGHYDFCHLPMGECITCRLAPGENPCLTYRHFFSVDKEGTPHYWWQERDSDDPTP